MSELVVIGFEDKYKADEVMLALLKLEQEYLIDLEDAVVLTRNSEGKFRIKPYYDLIAQDGLTNNFWGKLITTLLHKSDIEALAEIGIDKQFVQEVKQMMKPESSAIFSLVRRVNSDKVLQELQEYKGKVLQTTLSKEKAAELEAALS